jgi:hypothetical protein
MSLNLFPATLTKIVEFTGNKTDTSSVCVGGGPVAHGKELRFAEICRSNEQMMITRSETTSDRARGSCWRAVRWRYAGVCDLARARRVARRGLSAAQNIFSRLE